MFCESFKTFISCVPKLEAASHPHRNENMAPPGLYEIYTRRFISSGSISRSKYVKKCPKSLGARERS